MKYAPLNPAAEFDYCPRVRELFADLRHAGSLAVGARRASPSETTSTPEGEARLAPVIVSVAVGSHERGANVIWQVQQQNDVLQKVRYQAYGCPHFLAGCELLARWLEGKPVAALNDWNWRDLEAELHAPPSKRSHWLLLEDAARQMAKKLIE